MPTGLVALLDDVAAIAKVAAASVDDIGVAAARAGTKSAGVVIDDAAVTPQYVTGFSPARELPMIWKIAKGSFKNKLVFLLPAAVLLGQFAPFLIPFILVMGGLFLCYEAAEKILEWLRVDETTKHEQPAIVEGPGREDDMVSGAIRTDLILSAEIMAIALSEVTDQVWWQQGIILALIGIVITVVVYGAVALIVKMDDIGLHLAKENEGALASFGRGLVRFMPKLLTGISIIGTLAMAWVGGGLLVHNIAAIGWHGPEHLIDWISHPLVGMFPASAASFASGVTFAILSGVLGVAVGAVMAPLVHKVMPHGEGH
ncbi:MAG: ABC transporter [Sphingopyxis sp.]|nr:MAG: ABC transporter [Sphingopyxis sp.]